MADVILQRQNLELLDDLIAQVARHALGDGGLAHGISAMAEIVEHSQQRDHSQSAEDQVEAARGNEAVDDEFDEDGIEEIGGVLDGKEHQDLGQGTPVHGDAPQIAAHGMREGASNGTHVGAAIVHQSRRERARLSHPVSSGAAEAEKLGATGRNQAKTVARPLGTRLATAPTSPAKHSFLLGVAAVVSRVRGRCPFPDIAEQIEDAVLRCASGKTAHWRGFRPAIVPLIQGRPSGKPLGHQVGGAFLSAGIQPSLVQLVVSPGVGSAFCARAGRVFPFLLSGQALVGPGAEGRGLLEINTVDRVGRAILWVLPVAEDVKNCRVLRGRHRVHCTRRRAHIRQRLAPSPRSGRAENSSR